MAKVQITTLWEIGSGANATGQMFEGAFDETQQRSKSVTLVYEALENRRIELTGKNLQYSDGDLIAGKVTGISYEDADGKPIIKISDVNINIKAFKALPEDFAQWLYDKSTAGNDRIVGSSDSDMLYGGPGNDTLVGGNGWEDSLEGGAGNDLYIGGQGSDWFGAGRGQGRDTVRDFDANRELNDAKSQDYIAQYTDDYVIRQRGKDTVIDWGEGDMLILLGVKRADIDETDFLF